MSQASARQEIAKLQEQASDWLGEFSPRRWLRNGHLQTLVGNYLRRPPFLLSAEEETVLVDASDGSRVLCHCHWQPEPVRADRMTLVLVHGLEGSSRSQYILGITVRAWAEGWNVIRMNMRNCGGTDQLSPTLYHSGLSGDVDAVMRHFQKKQHLQKVALVGYSMGGNLVLKLAGELGRETPAWLLGVVGVSPAMDLAASSDALHEPVNRAYERHFLRNLMRTFRRKQQAFPKIYTRPLTHPVRSVRDFDEYVMTPYEGFSGADDYYFRAAAARVASRITVPTLVLHALDDPFIRMEKQTRQDLLANPHVTLVETPHGGHCAFLDAPCAGHDGRWAEKTLIDFLKYRMAG